MTAYFCETKPSVFPSKIKLSNHLSCQYMLYGSESRMLTADLESRIQALKTNAAIWIYLSTIKHCKLSWFGHVCQHDMLLKTILQGTVQGGHHKGRKTLEIGEGQHQRMDRPVNCCCCCSSLTTGVDGQPSQQRRLLECPQRRLGIMGVGFVSNFSLLWHIFLFFYHTLLTTVVELVIVSRRIRTVAGESES